VSCTTAARLALDFDALARIFIQRPPACLSAECIGGTCSISPKNLAGHSRTDRAATFTGRCSMISPSGSPLLVRTPSFTSPDRPCRHRAGIAKTWSPRPDKAAASRWQRIERAGVAGLFRAIKPFGLLQRDVGAQADGLVQQQDAVNLSLHRRGDLRQWGHLRSSSCGRSDLPPRLIDQLRQMGAALDGFIVMKVSLGTVRMLMRLASSLRRKPAALAKPLSAPDDPD
jgi:hypothetical protein